jgi:Na+-translocating ferredoxin:NAD+ oxidoreductase RnfG subunit
MGDTFEVGTYADGTPGEEKVLGRTIEGGVLYTAVGIGFGYEGDIVVVVSVKANVAEAPVAADPVIEAMEILSCNDTPEFGDRVFEVLEGADRPWFQDQFSGKRLSDLVLDMDPETDRVAAITGATITSEGAVEATRLAVQRIIDRTGEAYGE